MTFSLLARDPVTGQLGVASQSHYLGVGSVVTWAEAGIGVVATQAFAVRGYGPRGLALMRAGSPAPDALAQLLGADADCEMRQVAFLDAAGEFGIHTGTRCVGSAGVARGEHVVGLGNMLDNGDVPQAMVRGFHGDDGDLAHRLVAGLLAADEAGGDIRGRQSAAVLVVDGAPTDAPWDGIVRDLRVDDHPDPIGELHRLLDLNDAVDDMSQVVFAPNGPILGPPQPDSAYRSAAASLAAVAERLGDNPEATFWEAVLQARWGRAGEAKGLLETAARHNPRLPTFFSRLADAGILTPENISGLV
ncbi:DUF1028 domain-containing protein [Mycolicibacterium alvei]|uniref:Uncharacterized protein n=1 Tax=Mycolicibacterium alvei TaxID=67081 RepID=A0A6N4UVY2_9MYCO|nr:DUF1028 domain-containing protein [Mycolicibacterium alvei]MCV7003922.1 DUF1028 domain-containing protein [Mycolicibacterium alvei]BBX27681.1 hypothetical protein MALV_28060 [Mycolicibacterium alvei]